MAPADPAPPAPKGLPATPHDESAASAAGGIAELNAGAEQVWLAAHQRHAGLSVEVLPEVDSTNALVLARGRQGQTEPLVLAAWRQTAGRGRLGRTWQSQPGDSLTFSIGLAMNLADVPGGASALSLAAGLAVADALEAGEPASLPQPIIRLKWPNDLWADGRKLGGILIEAVPAPGLPATHRWVVVGVGINLRGAALLDDPTARTDLAQAGLGTLPGAALARLAPALLNALVRFGQEGFAPLQARYAARDVLIGQPVALWRHAAAQAPSPEGSGAGPDETGTARGVAHDGALCVQPDGAPPGQIRHWTAGEVSVRPHRL